MCQTPRIENNEATEPKPDVIIALAKAADALTSILKNKLGTRYNKIDCRQKQGCTVIEVGTKKGRGMGS